MTTQGMNRLYALNQREKSKMEIKASALIQDTFNCAIGESRCPIKRQNLELTNQITAMQEETHSIQSSFEKLRQEVEDAALDKAGKIEVLAILSDVKESELLAERDERISKLKGTIEQMKAQLDQSHEANLELQADIQEIQKIGVESDLSYKSKYKEYKDLLRKIDYLNVRLIELTKKETGLVQSINQHEQYSKHLANEINQMVAQAQELDKHVAKMQAKQRRFEPVKDKEKKGWTLRFRKPFKNAGKP